MPEVSDPRYSFKKPPEWDDLVACAEAAIVPDHPKEDQTGAVDVLIDALPELDVQSQDNNRYYGIGLVACKFSKSCFVPAGIPGSIIPSAVDALVYNHSSWHNNPSDGLRLKDIKASLMIHHTEKDIQPALAAYAELSLAERITIDTLRTFNGTPGRPRLSKEQYYPSILHQEGTLSDVRRDTFTSAANLFQVGAKKMLAGGIDTSEDSHTDEAAMGDVLIKDILTDEQIRSLCSVTTAAQICRLRVDEANTDLPSYIYVDQQGVARFNKSSMPEEAIMHTDSRAGYRSRIGCPALFIAGAVAFAVHALPEIIIQSQQRILAGNSSRQ